MELVIYICPEVWKPEGIFLEYSGPPFLSHREENKDIEITLYLCPEKYHCDGYEITLLMIKNNQRPLCLLVPLSVASSGEDKIQQLFVDMHNRIRSTHPQECSDPRELKIDENLSAMAEWYAKDMLKKNYYHHDHTDSFNRSISTRANDFQIEYVRLGENIGMIEGEVLPDDVELVEKFIEGWMNSPPHRKNIMTPEFNKIGIGFARGEGMSIKIEPSHVVEQAFAVVDFAVLKQEDHRDAPVPEFECELPEINRIKWHQTYSIEEYTSEDGERRTRKIPGNQIVFQMKLPLLCVLEKALFRFEVSPCKWELNPRSLLKKIPEDNSLHIVWSGENAGGESFIDRDGNLSVIFNISQACFVPGEWMALYVWIRGEVECNPIVWAAGWFETKCFTSGIVQGCGLLEGDEIIEGGYLNNFNTSWIGDERLHWLVWYKGRLVWLKSSDWKEYRIGERCFIYKNGYGFFNNHEGLNTRLPPGCRWPVLSLEPLEDIIVSDSNVSYRLDRNSDIIVPYSFMGI